MNNINTAAIWYAQLIKPDWAPPAFLFGPVWTILYILIAISFGKVFWMYYKKELPSRIVVPFAINIFANLAFSPIQFGLQNNTLALLDIMIVLITLVWAMVIIRPYRKWIFYIQIPYLLWVSFATILQISITYLNF